MSDMLFSHSVYASLAKKSKNHYDDEKETPIPKVATVTGWSSCAAVSLA